MPTFDFLPLPTHTPGTVRHLHVCRYGKAGARPKVYVQAGVHADELPANLAAHGLALTLGALEEEGRITGEIVVTPVANPVGLSQVILNDLQGRYHAGHGGNFNRGWPDVSAIVAERAAGRLGADRKANTELVRALTRDALDEQTPRGDYEVMRHTLARLACDADIMLDLHTDADAVMHLYLDPDDWPAAADLAGLLDAIAVIFARNSGDRPFDEAIRQPYLAAGDGRAARRADERHRGTAWRGGHRREAHPAGCCGVDRVSDAAGRHRRRRAGRATVLRRRRALRGHRCPQGPGGGHSRFREAAGRCGRGR